MNEQTLHEAEKFLHEQIPLTRAMGARVLPEEGDGFAIEAPVALNHNHLRTAFGGSINAIATLAGYVLLWFELRNEPVHVVISASSIRFLKPIRESIRAICEQPPRGIMEAFHSSFQERGKATIQLQVRVVEKRIVVAHFKGTFVALRGLASVRDGKRSGVLRPEPRV